MNKLFENWRIEPIEAEGRQGFIIGAPSPIDGVRVNTSVWPDDNDPAHVLLCKILITNILDDSARLDWLVIGGGERIAANIKGSDERGWAVMDCSNGLIFAARGQKTFREAIDAAREKVGE